MLYYSVYTSYTSHTLYSNVGNSHQCDAPNNAWRECFFSAQVSQEYSRHTSRFLCLDETAEVEDMEVELLKGTERYWKLRCVLLSINSTNGVNRQCVPSSDSSIWNNPPDIKANDITVACNDLSVLGLRCQLRCCILFSPHSSVRTVYVLILPFALIELGHLMPVAVTVTAWALLSIEDGQLLDMSETIAFVQSTSRLQDQPAIQVVDVLAQTGSDTVHRSQMMVS